MELESCSHPLKMRKSCSFDKKLGSFGYEFFMSDVITGIGFGIFVPRHQAKGPKPNNQFFVSNFE